MRRLPLLCFVVVLVGLAAPAFAQSTAEKNYGITAGFGIGYGTVPEGADRKMEPTFNIGGVAVFPISENWAFQPELKFDRRKITIGGITTDVNYINVPVLLRSKFLGIFMVQGVSVNNVVSASVFDVDFKDAITTPDVAIVLGVGKRFERWSLEGRWESGLRTFQKDIDSGGVRMRSLTAVATVYLK